MTTVFAILLIVINLGKGLIVLVNKYAPEEIIVKKQVTPFCGKCSDNTDCVRTGQMQVDLRGSALRPGIQKKAMGIRVSE